MADHKQSVPDAIRAIRGFKGETQTQFASRISVGVATLARYETGDQCPKTPIIKLLAKLAKKEGLPEVAAVLNGEFTRLVRAKEERSRQKREGMGGQLKALRHCLEASVKQSKPLLDRITQLHDGANDSEFLRALLNVRQTLDRQTESIRDLKQLQDRLNRSTAGREAGSENALRKQDSNDSEKDAQNRTR